MKEDSVIARINALNVGEVYCEAVRVGMARAAKGDNLVIAKQRLQDKLSKQIARAREAGGCEFTQETLTMLGREKSVIVVVAVTRIGDEL